MDYSNLKATKTSKKKFDSEISISRKSAKSTKKNAKKAQKSAKKCGISLALVIICLVVGLFGGFAISKFGFASDTYEMVGSEDIYVGSEEACTSYTELGVKCIAFGKDISNECTVTYFFRDDLTNSETRVDSVDASSPGIYYAVYECKNIKYRSVKLVRNIIVLKEEDNG